jgi:hypothetical protein
LLAKTTAFERARRGVNSTTGFYQEDGHPHFGGDPKFYIFSLEQVLLMGGILLSFVPSVDDVLLDVSGQSVAKDHVYTVRLSTCRTMCVVKSVAVG